MPLLSHVGSLTISRNESLTSLLLPELATLSCLVLGQHALPLLSSLHFRASRGPSSAKAGLEAIALTALLEVEGELRVDDSPALQAMEVPLLAQVTGDARFETLTSLGALVLPDLVAIGGGRFDNESLGSLTLPARRAWAPSASGGTRSSPSVCLTRSLRPSRWRAMSPCDPGTPRCATRGLHL